MAEAGMAGASPASKSAPQVTLTFPDGATRPYPAGTTGLDVAKPNWKVSIEEVVPPDVAAHPFDSPSLWSGSLRAVSQAPSSLAAHVESSTGDPRQIRRASAAF